MPCTKKSPYFFDRSGREDRNAKSFINNMNFFIRNVQELLHFASAEIRNCYKLGYILTSSGNKGPRIKHPLTRMILGKAKNREIMKCKYYLYVGWCQKREKPGLMINIIILNIPPEISFLVKMETEPEKECGIGRKSPENGNQSGPTGQIIRSGWHGRRNLFPIKISNLQFVAIMFFQRLV